MTPTIRPLRLADLPAIAEIQRLNPASSQWNPPDYLAYTTLVAELDFNGSPEVAAFIALQIIPPNEAEILNLAVHPAHKRLGLATALFHTITAARIFLDVRESNAPALAFYKKHGFRKCGHRRKYYSRPTEDAIMMSRP